MSAVEVESPPRLPHGWAITAGPAVKSGDQYLDPWDWHDEPIPEGEPRPWELGHECGWLRLEGHGYRLTVAARTLDRVITMAPAVARATDQLEGRYGG
jgi:hypothetical protein